MMKQVITILAFLLFSQNLFSKELQIYQDKKLVKTFKAEEWKKEMMSKEEKGTFLSKELFNIHRREKHTYEGFSLIEVLEKSIGKKWKENKKIRFFAKDGVVKEALVKDMIKGMSKHTGIISIRNKGKKELDLFVKGINTIYPGPFYLVWSGFSEDDFSGGAFKWPYHLSKIVLISK